ncbi:MAG: chalcone isomerase family protein [Oceanospirillaceae bacterium]|nr:chalcone isomerase family protein [Oceanospirillaceae bacterium]MCP5351547.1 chalcone isomerase family protein [Oceanospirillaceae bacterium]
MTLKHAALAFAFLTLCAFKANAIQVDDIEMPDVLPATKNHPELHINGAALRELYLLIRSYVGALYLEHPTTNAEEALNSETHKRMVFHVLLKKVGARRIANALQEALVVNVTAEEHDQLRGAIDQMLGYFDGKMHEGEEASFDYMPGKGTLVTINGEEKGVIKGKLFFHALLSIWIGENPVGREFKEEILGLHRAPEEKQVAHSE